MAVEEHNESNWNKAANGLDKTARRYLFGIRGIQTLFLLTVFVNAIVRWVKLDDRYVGTFLLVLGLGVMTIPTVALGKWRSFLAQPGVDERVGHILILGPDYIKDIFQHTPGMFRFMLGSPPNNLLKAAGFVSQHLRWFLNQNPVEYKQVYGPVLATLSLVVFALAKVFVLLSGYQTAYLNLAGGLLPVIDLSLLSGLLGYYIYLLERQVIALKRVAGIIRGLASPE